MKIITYISLLLIFVACNNTENNKVSNPDTTNVAPAQKDTPSEQKQTFPIDESQVEVRFDKIKPLLVKDLSEDKIKTIESQLTSAIAASDDSNTEKIFTASLKQFLEDKPDDITIEMEPDSEKKFKKKWGKTHDVYNLNFMNPYYDGNGGCSGLSLKSFSYLGTYNQAYFVEVKILCKMDGAGESFRRYFKIIEDGSSFKIDGIYAL